MSVITADREDEGNWFTDLFTPFYVTSARPCFNHVHAIGMEADAVLYVTDVRRKLRRPFHQCDIDGNPQRMYMFNVSKSRKLLNPSKRTLEKIRQHFLRVNIEIDSYAALLPNDEFKFVVVPNPTTK